MRSRTLLIVLAFTALCVAVILAMHGQGHAMLAKWMPAIHGR
jgi:hypothetical protein